jgi:hypothetical protein
VNAAEPDLRRQREHDQPGDDPRRNREWLSHAASFRSVKAHRTPCAQVRQFSG